MSADGTMTGSEVGQALDKMPRYYGKSFNQAETRAYAMQIVAQVAMGNMGLDEAVDMAEGQSPEFYDALRTFVRALAVKAN